MLPLAGLLASMGRCWGQAQCQDLGELEEHPWGTSMGGTEIRTRNGLHSLSPADWHSSFPWYSPLLSCLGCLVCLCIMFVLTWWAALMALLLTLLLLCPFYKKPGVSADG